MMKIIKTHGIYEYFREFKSNPEQDSDEWIKARTKTIGGSEIAVIQGISPFNTIRGLMESKVNSNRWEGTFATLWGKTFESIVQQWCHMKFDTTITGTNAFLRDFPDHEGFSFSPDGIGLVNFEELHYHNGKVVGSLKRYRTVLFEFKAPFSRSVKENDDPPPYYISQVKMGLDLINITDMGLLVEAVIRRCAWEDLNYTATFDRIIHAGNGFKKALGFGCMYLYAYTEYMNYTVFDKFKMLCEKEDLDYDDAIDFGTCSKELLEEVMYLVSKDLMLYYRSTICIPESEENMIEKGYWRALVIQKQRDIKVLGVLPWKIMRVVYNPIEKEIGYLDEYKDKVIDVLSTIEKCRENPENTNHILDEYFSTTTEDYYEYV